MAIDASVVAALGWALLDFLWQGLVVGALAALALLALGKARPQARYAAACIALFACLALPLASVWLELAGTDATALIGAGGESVLRTGDALAAPALALPSPAGWRQAMAAQLPVIVAAWSVGALLLALRLLIGCRWVGRLRAGARLPNSWWQGRFDELAVRVGLHAPVPLRISEGIDSPVAAGWWRPVVLVPAALLAGMPVELLEALLAHELAHVRRRDYLVNLMQGVVETLLFYHPVVWWLSRQVRIEREQIADDLASRALGDPRRLALALQALDRFQQANILGPARLPHAPGLLPAAHGGNLMSRIKHLLRPDHQRPDWKLALPVAALAVLGLALNAAQVTASPVPAAAVAATPAVPATPRVPYALVRKDRHNVNLSGDLSDLDEVKRARRHLDGDFLWFRRDGVGYVVQDAALMARVDRAWAPADAISAKMDALSAQMQPHSARMEALGKQMEAYSGRAEPYTRQMEALSKRIEPLARQQADLAEQMSRLSLAQAARQPDGADDAATHVAMQRLQSQMDVLQPEMERLSREMEKHSAAMQKVHAPMEELGRQMEAAGKPMQELGAKLEPLGREMEALSHRAEAEVNQVIDAAVREGKAVPASSLKK